MLKTIGIYGGMGSVAGASFYLRLVSSYIGTCETLQPHVILRSDSDMPRRDKSLEMQLQGIEPIHFKRIVLSGLSFFKQNKVSFVAVPCNTFHFFRNELEEKSGVKIIDMISAVTLDTQRQNPNMKKVALLATAATIKSKLYHNSFEKLTRIEVICPNAVQQDKINRAIEYVKKGQADNPMATMCLNSVMQEMLLKYGINHFILGCTELPEIPRRASFGVTDTTLSLLNEVKRQAEDD